MEIKMWDNPGWWFLFMFLDLRMPFACGNWRQVKVDQLATYGFMSVNSHPPAAWVSPLVIACKNQSLPGEKNCWFPTDMGP